MNNDNGKKVLLDVNVNLIENIDHSQNFDFRRESI